VSTTRVLHTECLAQQPRHLAASVKKKQSEDLDLNLLQANEMSAPTPSKLDLTYTLPVFTRRIGCLVDFSTPREYFVLTNAGKPVFSR
jgi:hypothetical protein